LVTLGHDLCSWQLSNEAPTQSSHSSCTCTGAREHLATLRVHTPAHWAAFKRNLSLQSRHFAILPWPKECPSGASGVEQQHRKKGGREWRLGIVRKWRKVKQRDGSLEETCRLLPFLKPPFGCQMARIVHQRAGESKLNGRPVDFCLSVCLSSRFGRQLEVEHQLGRLATNGPLRSG